MSSSNDVLMEPGRMRLNSLDTWRGLVIFLMMLDHVRDFFNRGALTVASLLDDLACDLVTEDDAGGSRGAASYQYAGHYRRCWY